MLRSVELSGFANHRESILRLRGGVTLVIGKNGSGKSSLSEAIYWALYGRSLRSVSGWSPVEIGSSVRLVFSDPDFVVDRKRSRSGTKLTIEGSTRSVRTRENQSHVDTIFGDFRTSTSTRVFHQSLLAKFALASDLERKTLVESLIGIDVFDGPRDRLQDELRRVKSELWSVGEESRRIKSEIDRVTGRLHGLRDFHASLDTIVDVDAEIVTLSDRLARAGSVSRPEKPVPIDSGIVRSLQSLESDRRVVLSEIQRVEGLLRAGKCPMCGQTFCAESASGVEALRETLADFDSKLDELRNAALLEQQSNSDYRNRYESELHEFEKHIREKSSLEALLESAESRKLRLLDSIRTHDHIQHELEAVLESLEEELRRVAARSDFLESRERRLDDLIFLFGNRGARVVALRNAFVAISTGATRVCRRIYFGDVNHASPRIDLEISDDLQSVSVVCHFGDRCIPYRGLSSGERSVVDFSILKSLASIQCERRVSIPIVYDDIFDTLDSDVRLRIASFIECEASNNQVILFTHDPEIQSLFKFPHTVRVENGVLF